MNQYLPEKLVSDIRLHIKLSTSEWNMKEKTYEKLVSHTLRLWLFIQRRELYNKKMRSYPDGYWSNIFCKDLQKFNSRVPEASMRLQYPWFLDILKKTGWILSNEKYKPSEYTKSYKTPDIDTIWNAKIFDTTWSINTPRDTYEKIYERDKSLISSHYQTHLDIKEVSQTLGKLLNHGYKGKKITNKWIWEQKQAAYHFSIQDFWFHRTDGGRFYSNFTSLPSFLRRLVKINGSDTKSIDLKNGLPLIVAHHIDDEVFLDICREGKLYDYITSKLVNTTREKTKELLFSNLFYSKHEPSGLNPFIYNLNKLFPKLSEKIWELRKEKSPLFNKWYEREESSIFIEGLRDQPYPYLTCHDSVYVEADKLDFFRNIVEDNMYQNGYIGLLKIE